MSTRKGTTKQSGTSGQSRPALGGSGELATDKPGPVIIAEAKPEWPPATLHFEPPPAEVDEPEDGEEGVDGEGGEDGRDGEV